jgi:hypothetical protein
MEQRIYHGNINPDDLANYLVGMFNQGPGGTVAQKIGQGDSILVQIGLLSHSGRRIRQSIGLSIARTPVGISVTSGQANWLDDPHLGGSLIGALFWPPLLLFPFARGINAYGLYQDIRQAVETFCAQAGARQGETTTAHAVYCQQCGSANQEGARFCQMCGAPLSMTTQQTQQNG